MVSLKRIPLSRSELTFWKAAFLTNEHSVQRKHGRKLPHPAGAAHVAAEYANHAVLELRRVKRDGIQVQP